MDDGTSVGMDVGADEGTDVGRHDGTVDGADEGTPVGADDGMDVGRDGNLVEDEGKEMSGKRSWQKLRAAVPSGEKGGWDVIFDAASGSNYYVDRLTGRASWTDRTGESTAEDWGGRGRENTRSSTGEMGEEN